MAAVRRYAQGTTVEVSKTKGEMMELLSKHGATHQGFGVEENPPREIVVFKIAGRHYRFELLKPTREEMAAEAGPRTSVSDLMDREWRRRWRARLLFMKALFEFVEGDDAEAQKLLLPFVLMADGQTLGDAIDPQIDTMYTSGKMPPLLTGGKN